MVPSSAASPFRVKQVVLTALIGVALVGVLWWIAAAFWLRPPPIDAVQVRNAIETFCRERKALGFPLPQTVTLKELVQDGYLHPEAIRGMGPVDVTFALRPDVHNPGSVLIEARLPDGTLMGALANGSVQALQPPRTNH